MSPWLRYPAGCPRHDPWNNPGYFLIPAYFLGDPYGGLLVICLHDWQHGLTVNIVYAEQAYWERRPVYSLAKGAGDEPTIIVAY